MIKIFGRSQQEIKKMNHRITPRYTSLRGRQIKRISFSLREEKNPFNPFNPPAL